MAAPEQTTPRARVEHLLGRRLRFTLQNETDGERDERVVTGTFQCLDRHRNFILRDASELRIFEGGARRRTLGAALVPGRHLTKVEALRGDLARFFAPHNELLFGFVGRRFDWPAR